MVLSTYFIRINIRALGDVAKNVFIQIAVYYKLQSREKIFVYLIYSRLGHVRLQYRYFHYAFVIERKCQRKTFVEDETIRLNPIATKKKKNQYKQKS